MILRERLLEKLFRNVFEIFSKENASSVFTSKYSSAIFLYYINIFSNTFSSLSRVTWLIYKVKFSQIQIGCDLFSPRKKRKKHFFSIMIMFTRNKTTKNTCNSAPTTIYCAVGEKSKFKMLNSNNNWHGKV